MAIDEAEVRRIARLAHLEYPRVRDREGSWVEPDEHLIDDATLRKLAADITQILEHVKALSEVDVSNVEPTSHGVPLPPLFREDEPETERIDPERLLEGAPARSGGAVSVPKIVE
jgi:aspartyl-tRNA(Asn)/glutamyl-tRNA(Gln) amidotransferase subunit C